MNLLENLKWRYATKKYDTSKKIPTQDIEQIKSAIQLSASSYGLQLYKMLWIEDEDKREQLKSACWGQPAITDASHLIVFCNPLDVEESAIDGFMKIKSETQGIELDKIQGYGDFIKGKMTEKTVVEKRTWMAKQNYIALANAMAACAELKIDSTPMEGFEAEKVNDVLNLKEKGLEVSVILALGYRSEEDETQNGKKVRRPMSELFETV